jgi:poly(A) polymerase/tRNA nucleotidyltransferase (CCA-adding enzyme)
MTDRSLYAGRWVAWDEARKIVSVGETAEDVRRVGHQARPKERLSIRWISPHPPYLALPEWPFNPLKPLLDRESVWLVGGAVRDLLLNRPQHDWDFAVQGAAMALARDVADTLGGAYVTLDAERDTARVVVGMPGRSKPVMLDFATLRRPTLKADLHDRDFTINAMALTLDGQLIDPEHGQHDLQAHRVRAVSKHSLPNDPARLLRAVRTAAELHFEIEPQTLADMQEYAERLTDVAAERICAELTRIVAAEPAAQSLERLEALDLLVHVLPELLDLKETHQTRPHHYETVWGHTLAAMSALEGLLALVEGKPRPPQVAPRVRAPQWAWRRMEEELHPFQPTLQHYLEVLLAAEMPRRDLLKWGALLHDIGKAETRSVDDEGKTHFYGHEDTGADAAHARLRALRFPNSAKHFVRLLIAEHMRILGLEQNPPPSRRAIYRFYRAAEEAGVGVVLLHLADTLAVWGPGLKREHWETVLAVATALLDGYFRQQETVVAPPPLLTGHDLLDRGVPQGPEIGRLLRAAREAQAAGELTSREEALHYVMDAYQRGEEKA